MAPQIPRIVVPRIPDRELIRTLEPPIISTTEPTVLRPLRPPVVNIPSAEIPSYEPIQTEEQVPKPKQEEKEDSGEQNTVESPPLPAPRIPQPPTPPLPPEKPARGSQITVPIIELEIPVPTTKEVTLAGTTAVAATASALLGKSLVDYLLKIFKPLAKKALLALKKVRGKKFTDFEIQDYFLFENEPDMKKVIDVLEKDRRQEILRQALEQSEQ